MQENQDTELPENLKKQCEQLDTKGLKWRAILSGIH